MSPITFGGAPVPPTTHWRPLARSWLFVLLSPLEDKHDVGRVLDGEVLGPVALRNPRAGHANSPLVTFQFVDAVLLFPLLRAALVQIVDRLGGSSWDRRRSWLDIRPVAFGQSICHWQRR